jgi:hypothetical protein
MSYLDELAALERRTFTAFGGHDSTTSQLGALNQLADRTYQLTINSAAGKDLAELGAACLLRLLWWSGRSDRSLLAELSTKELGLTLHASGSELLHCEETGQDGMPEAGNYLITLLAWALVAGVDLRAAVESRLAALEARNAEARI